MANPNYAPAYRQYTQQSAGYALPSSVRTYSVFDPNSNSWRRMTNDGMSPMPQGNQPDIQAALAQARGTQGTVYPAEGMGQGQPVEMHPGYVNPPAQTPVGGPRTPSPASGGGGAVPVQGQLSRASQRAVEAPAAVQTGNPYMGYAEIRKEYGDPEADVAFLHEQPRGVPVTGKINTRGVGDVQSPFATPADVVVANRGLPPTERPVTIHDAINAEYNNIPLRLQQMTGLMGGGLNVGPALASFRAGDASVAAARKAYQNGMMRSQLRRPVASKQTSTPFSDAPEIEAANRFSPLRSDWVSPKRNVRMNSFVTTPNGSVYRYKPMLGYDTPALPTPKAEVPTGRTSYVQTPEVIVPYGGFRALPNGASNLHMGTIEASSIRPNIATPLQMTTPSGLARWQYRLDQLSGLGR